MECSGGLCKKTEITDKKQKIKSWYLISNLINLTYKKERANTKIIKGIYQYAKRWAPVTKQYPIGFK